MNSQKPSRGEVWFVSLDPTIGHEQEETRPCLIISHDTFNYGPAQLHIVLPMTSKDRNHPFHVPIEWQEGGSDMKSFILCDQMRTVSCRCFKGKSLGTVSSKTFASIESILSILINV